MISVDTQCNINEEIKKLLDNRHIGQHIQNEVYANGGMIFRDISIIDINLFFVLFLDNNINTEKCVIKYYKPPLDVAIQVCYHYTFYTLQLLLLLNSI